MSRKRSAAPAPPPPSLATACVHAGSAPERVDTPPLVPPLYQAAVFETPSLDLVARALTLRL